MACTPPSRPPLRARWARVNKESIANRARRGTKDGHAHSSNTWSGADPGLVRAQADRGCAAQARRIAFPFGRRAPGRNRKSERTRATTERKEAGGRDTSQKEHHLPRRALASDPPSLSSFNLHSYHLALLLLCYQHCTLVQPQLSAPARQPRTGSSAAAPLRASHSSSINFVQPSTPHLDSTTQAALACLLELVLVDCRLDQHSRAFLAVSSCAFICV